MRRYLLPQSIFRMVLVLGVILGLSTPLLTLAQDTAPQEVPAPPVPGAIQISLYGNDGMPLSGSFAVSDSAGTYQEVWASGGSAWAGNIAAGPASVSQLSGTTDYAPDYAAKYVEILAGGTTSLAVVNAFLDADVDGIGNSLDICPAGNDRLDTDVDGIADACDPTPNGDNDGDGIDNLADLTPNGDPTPAPTVQPTVVPTVIPTPEPTTAPAVDPTAVPGGALVGPELASTPQVAEEEMATLDVEVAVEPVIVEEAPVSCQDAQATAPWISSDLEDYPPGGLVTLSSGSWVPGQVVEILVEDDGIADAEQGVWNHTATVTANESGGFTYSFNIAPWYVADYSVVATGECSTATTTFTDSVAIVTPGGSLQNCAQVPAGAEIQPGGSVTVTCSYLHAASKAGWASITIPAFGTGDAAFSATVSIVQSAGGTVSGSSATTPVRIGFFHNYQSVQVTIVINAASSAATGVFFEKTFTACDNNGNSATSACLADVGAIKVSLTVARQAFNLTENTHYTFGCTPSSHALTTFAVVESICTVRALTLPTNGTIRLDHITTTVSGGTTGWSVGLISGGTPFGILPGITTLSGTTLVSGGSYSFQVRFTPTACSATTSTPAVAITMGMTPFTNTNPGTAHTTSAKSVSASFAAPATTTVSAAITSNSLSWSKPYSLAAYPDNAGSLTYSVEATGCAGWNVQVSASNFVRTGGGDPIPASNLTLTQAQAPAPTTAGLSTPVTSGSLAAPLKVLSAQATVPIGSYTQTLNLNMNIPAGTLAGDYTSTVTITAASGP